ncbi:MAG: YkgJ family cysteine cluster protein [Burkholderiaceae bacterium]|nr:YkgJ family cysteine cluster protein [Burkholderiaceae bacterium]
MLIEVTGASCHPGCGACCIAPSITSPIPGMPGGKPAGVRCVQLDDAHRCRLFGRPERPAFCAGLQPSPLMCGPAGDGGRHALHYLAQLELLTQPR